MSKHTIVATPSGGLAFSVAVRQHRVSVDQPERAGGADEAPTPLEMLSVSFAGCVALYARKYCLAHALDADGLTVEVKPIWRENPGRIGRFDVLLRVPDSIPEEHHEGLAFAAGECPVHHTLAHQPEIVMRLEQSAMEPVLAG